MSRITMYRGGAMSLVAMLFASTALAEAAATPSAADDKSSATIEEIIITAQKRSENLQRASISVDTVEPENLQKRGITNAIDLQQMVPALHVVENDQFQPTIRGLGTFAGTAGVDVSVALSQDGVYLPHPPAMTPILFDLQRVEAVLGPQGTLYGRNSNAGVINFISNDPKRDFGGYMQAGVGNYEAWSTEGAFNAPLSDTLAMRVSGATSFHGPYTDDGTNSLKSYAGRIKFLYDPNERLSVLLTIDGAYQGTLPQNSANCPPGLIGVGGCVGVKYVPWQGMSPRARSMYNHDSIFGASTRITYDLGWSDLTSLTGYRQYRLRTDTGPPWLGGVDNFDYVANADDKFLTQEIRLSSKDDSKVKWVAGLYVSDETESGLQAFRFHRNTDFQIYLGFPDNYEISAPVSSATARSYALFGDVTTPLFVPNLRLRAGLRYTYEQKSLTGANRAGIENNGPTFSYVPTTGTEIQRRPTWKLGLDWDVSPDSLLYATVSTGFKSGGVNILPAYAASATIYRPETVTAVEIGSKNRFLENRLQVNAAVFHYDYRNYQTSIFYQPQGPSGPTSFPVVNSQVATFEGGEFNVLYRLTHADTVNFDLNYLNNKFDKFVVVLPNFVQDLSGTDVPLSPRTTFSIGYEHEFALAGGGALTVGVNSQIVSSQVAQGSYGDNHVYHDPAFHKTGVNISYVSADGAWTANAYVRNIENEAVISALAGGYPLPGIDGFIGVHEEQPRTYGVSIRRNF
jgi:iron complex outermembrane receptor protein